MNEVSVLPSVVHSTFVIERTFPVAAERVFAAFADPVAKRRWYGEGPGRIVETFTMDFRVGGLEHARFRFAEGTPFPGVVFVNRTTYQDIVPDRRIVTAYTMGFEDRTFSASLATIELVPVEGGTQLFFTDQGAFFAGSDTPEMRQGGWGRILDELGVELGR